MGFKSKQVSSDDIDDDDSLNKMTLLDNSTSTKNHDQEQQQQRADVLDCPRCSSRNTKFCYYNNYNRSQPRHFCKDCKRYWTKGGTLRNVPAGCGRNRKNKRLKTLNSAKTTTTIATVPIPSSTANTNPHLPAQEGLKAVTDNDQKKISDFLFEAFSVDNTSPQHVIQNLSFSGGLGFNGQPSPIPGIYSSQLDSIGSSSITENYNNIFCQPLQGPEDASSHELTNWWNLNDLDTLISVDDLWDDTEEEINP